MLRKVYLDPDENKLSLKQFIKAFLYLLDNKKKKYLILLLLLFTIELYSLVPPFILGKIVDFFTNLPKGGSLTPFYIYAIFLGLSFSIAAFIRLNLKKSLDNLRTEVVYLTNVKAFEKLVNLSLLETREETAGEKVTKVQNGVKAFRRLSIILRGTISSSLTSVIGILIVFIFLKTSYTIFLLIYVIGFFSIIRYFFSRIQKLNYEFNQAMEKSGGAYVEGLSNILTIKSMGAKRSFGTHVASKEALRKEFEIEIRNYSNGQWQAFQIFNGICIAIFLLLIGSDVVAESISLGSIVIFFGYLQRLTGSASETLSNYEDLIASKTAIDRMIPIFWSENSDERGNRSFPKNWDKIEISNGSFEYKRKEDKKNKVGVKNINITIKNGQKIGLVGKSGCGKSTLVKLLIGLYPLDSGTIEINNINLHEIKENSLLKNISLVLQETEMFNLSVKDNITLMRKIKQDTLERSIKVAQLQKVIQGLPEGIDTLIGEKGYHLSGGERQRVGLARAIYRNPQILILDEATSSLDTKTENKIQESLESEFTQETMVIVAHRVSTLKHVDKIYVMEEGKIIEEGKYDDLVLNPKSKFFRIYRSQQKQKNKG